MIEKRQSAAQTLAASDRPEEEEDHDDHDD
jgi:hypothetical protein